MFRLIFLIAIGLEATLLFGNYKILLQEEHIEVNKGISRIVPGYGDLGANGQDSLICTYFDGRKTWQEVYWYSPNNVFGRSSCLFFKQDG